MRLLDAEELLFVSGGMPSLEAMQNDLNELDSGIISSTTEVVGGIAEIFQGDFTRGLADMANGAYHFGETQNTYNQTQTGSYFGNGIGWSSTTREDFGILHADMAAGASQEQLQQDYDNLSDDVDNDINFNNTPFDPLTSPTIIVPTNGEPLVYNVDPSELGTYTFADVYSGDSSGSVGDGMGGAELYAEYYHS